MDIKVKKRLLWAIIISIGFMFFLLLRIEWEHFSLIAGRLDIKTLIAAYCVFILGNLVRTFRFYKLDHMDNKLTHWWNINAFYNFITSTLPGGAGEAVTAYVLKRFSKFNILGAFRILLLSRFMDLLALSALFFISAILISDVTPYREAAIWLSGTLFLISSVALLRSSEQFALKLIQRLPGQNKLVQKVREKLTELLKIAEEQRSNNFFYITLIQSILMWIGSVAALYLALKSFGIDFTPVQSAYCFGVYALFQMVPVQGIAGIGTKAAWWALALTAAGYKAPDAVAMGIVLHATYYIFVTLLALFSLFFWFKGSGEKGSIAKT